MANTIASKYGYLWVTFFLFLLTLTGHWIFAWFAFAAEQTAHGQEIIISEYVIETTRDMLENWQSEFLQLIWQVAGLAFLLSVGSPQSKEGDERKEEKLDLILKKLDSKNASAALKRLDQKYPRK